MTFLTLLVALALSPMAQATSADADRLLRAERVGEALEEARRSVAADPTDVVAHEIVIDVLLNFGLGAESEALYKDWLKGREGDALAWYLLGRATLDANLARAAYLRSAEIAPRYGRAHMGLASVHRARGELDQAERAYRLALKLDPNLPEAWIGLGAVCIAQERPDEAVKVAEAAIKAVPGDPEAYLALAELRPERAVEILTQASQKVTTDPRIYASLAQELMRDGRYAEARAHVERAVILVPASPQINLLAMQVKELESGALTWTGAERLARARALANETPVAALVELDVLAKDFPSSALVALAQGHVKSARGDLAGAEAALGRALRLAPDSPDAQAALGLLWLGRNQAREAKPLLEAAWARRPQDASLGISVGMARLGTEGSESALTTLYEVARRSPADPRPIMAIVSVYSQLGQTQAAYNVLAEATARLPHPTLLVAQAAAAKDLGRLAEAVALLRRVYGITGEARYERLANELEAKIP